MKISRPRTHASGVHATGFSLVELLVAVLVMGIGVLGVTALQMVSLQNNRSALDRGQAVELAYDMMDRIRANPGANYAVALGASPPAATDCIANACSADQMKDFDLATWKCLLGSFNDDAVCAGFRDGVVLPVKDDQPGLPQGDGQVALNGAVATVTVQWTDKNGGLQTVSIDSQE